MAIMSSDPGPPGPPSRLFELTGPEVERVDIPEHSCSRSRGAAVPASLESTVPKDRRVLILRHDGRSGTHTGVQTWLSASSAERSGKSGIGSKTPSTGSASSNIDLP